LQQDYRHGKEFVMRSSSGFMILIGLLALGTLPGSMVADPLLPLASPPSDLRERCEALPAGCRERLHIYMINGFTILPHMCGSMNAMAPYVEDLGFGKPKIACHYWRWSYQNDIRRIHSMDPQARFVLVGYSMGASVVYSMAQSLEKDGVFIDLIVLIDGHSLIHDFKETPSNVGRVVSINATAWALAGKCRPGQTCYTVDSFFHLAAPRRPEALRFLGMELIETAAAAHGAALPSADLTREEKKK